MWNIFEESVLTSNAYSTILFSKKCLENLLKINCVANIKQNRVSAGERSAFLLSLLLLASPSEVGSITCWEFSSFVLASTRLAGWFGILYSQVFLAYLEKL